MALVVDRVSVGNKKRLARSCLQEYVIAIHRRERHANEVYSSAAMESEFNQVQARQR
jgi:hypothetical protein